MLICWYAEGVLVREMLETPALEYSKQHHHMFCSDFARLVIDLCYLHTSFAHIFCYNAISVARSTVDRHPTSQPNILIIIITRDIHPTSYVQHISETNSNLWKRTTQPGLIVCPKSDSENICLWMTKPHSPCNVWVRQNVTAEFASRIITKQRLKSLSRQHRYQLSTVTNGVFRHNRKFFGESENVEVVYPYHLVEVGNRKDIFQGGEH